MERVALVDGSERRLRLKSSTHLSINLYMSPSESSKKKRGSDAIHPYKSPRLVYLLSLCPTTLTFSFKFSAGRELLGGNMMGHRKESRIEA